MEIYNVILKDLGVCKVLDQTPPKKGDSDYNPTKSAIIRLLESMVNTHTDIMGFTLTFKKSFHDDDDRWLHKHVESTLLKNKWKDINYIIFPEYTKNGVLHYHGITWDEYQSNLMVCIKQWRRKYGFVKPELELKSDLNWIKYITKNYGKTGLWTLFNKKKAKKSTKKID